MNLGMEELRGYVPDAATLAPDVSKWSVGMHLHHVSLAMVGVCRSLVASEPPPPKSGFNPLTTVIFISGRIPRGRGKSPEEAIPRQGIGSDELGSMLDECERWLEEAGQASPDQWYRHFAFGVLDRDRTLRFLRIHNRHHARIIQDVLRA